MQAWEPSIPENQNYSSDNDDPSLGLAKPYDMDREIEVDSITHEILVTEVRVIYSDLLVVEKLCIKLHKRLSESKELRQAQWHTLLSQHSTLLEAHHDFLLSSQHPAAKDELTELAEKYTMPDRMWRYGIQPLLDLLLYHLPSSLEYMLHFFYFSYGVITLLVENTPRFRMIWFECLGDLARYRMAIEESDMRNREAWMAASRYWYNLGLDLDNHVGRLQHHLGVLAREDVLAQFFYYTKALICRQPFPHARESITLLFGSIRNRQSQDFMALALIATHDILFHGQDFGQCKYLANDYLCLLRREIPRFDSQGQKGVFVMSINFAAIFQYRAPEQVLSLDILQRQSQVTAAEAYQIALPFLIHTASEKYSSGRIDTPEEITSNISPVALNGGALTFRSMDVFLDLFEDPHAHAAIHTGLSFVWYLAIHPSKMEKLEPMIPWVKITCFLNSLLSFENDFEKIESDSYPRFSKENEAIRARNMFAIAREKEKKEACEVEGRRGEVGHGKLQPEIPDHLPEDFLIRGHTWSEFYYPAGFFERVLPEQDRPFIEPHLLQIVRRYRCLWLGVRLSMVRSKKSTI